ncbi:hypothetical protein [Vibrio coralliilyticus]|uniref:hypothetical protein n=1 Tax=Vibrio coralliilyticus TaxID=190893 RepID=UPI0020A507AF|nr:hypothetical protein [Vibrio coralliilyticus]
MRWILLSALIFAYQVIADEEPHLVPEEAIGVLEVNDMTSGQLLWLRGRVGEGSYTWVDQTGSHCTMKVPVAIGQIADSGLSIGSAGGMKMIVMSKDLNEALVQGERVNSKEWRFTKFGEGEADGWIVDGISLHEAFVLNSRRRWVSWLMGDTRSELCQQ